jgi:hypothetical protein
MLFRKANPTQTKVQPPGSEADQESLLLGGVVTLNFLNFLEDRVSSLSLWSLSCLRLDLLCLAGDLVLDLLDLGDLFLAADLSLGDYDRLLDDTVEVLVVVLLLQPPGVCCTRSCVRGGGSGGSWSVPEVGWSLWKLWLSCDHRVVYHTRSAASAGRWG